MDSAASTQSKLYSFGNDAPSSDYPNRGHSSTRRRRSLTRSYEHPPTQNEELYVKDNTQAPFGYLTSFTEPFPDFSQSKAWSSAALEADFVRDQWTVNTLRGADGEIGGDMEEGYGDIEGQEILDNSEGPLPGEEQSSTTPISQDDSSIRSETAAKSHKNPLICCCQSCVIENCDPFADWMREHNGSLEIKCRVIEDETFYFFEKKVNGNTGDLGSLREPFRLTDW